MHVSSRFGDHQGVHDDTEDGAVADKRPKKWVLVVEDDRPVSELLVALLEERGYHAVAAYDGASAIQLARKVRPHLITLDLALPGTDGHAVLESLKADASTRDIPVVVISAFTQILPDETRQSAVTFLERAVVYYVRSDDIVSTF